MKRLLLVTAVLLPACVLNPQPGPPVDPCSGVEQYLALCCAIYPQSASCRPATPVPTMGTPEPSPAPTASSTPTSTPTVAPTATPSPTPEPTATPAPTPFCIQKPGPDPITVAYRSACPKGMEPFHFEPEPRPAGVVPEGFTQVCGLAFRLTAWKLGRGTWLDPVKFPIVRHRSGAYVQQEINGGRHVCIDAIGRTFWNCEDLYVAGPEYEDPENEIYATGSYSKPPYCEATPAPTARPTVGPTPTPGGPTPKPIVGQCEDRAMDFVNGCDRLRYPKKLDDGRVRGQCDSTERIGCRLPGGEYYRNACDWPHWTGDSAAAQKTRVLCDHNGEPMAWDAHDGVSVEVVRVLAGGPVETERDGGNPFQWWLTAPEGTVAEVRACPASIPIRTEDGRTLPVRGDGCGEAKPVRFEVR